jgi:diketogulonate reductase-like aldo/keto reductase
LGQTLFLTVFLVVDNYDIFPSTKAKDPVELTNALEAALQAGYRHFDTAYAYENESILGEVFAKWLSSGRIKRQELFIVTKVGLGIIILLRPRSN